MRGHHIISGSRICERCKGEYVPIQYRQKYCSPLCGSKARTEAMRERFKQELTQTEIISKAMSALAKRGAEKRRKLKQEALKEDHENQTDN